MMRAIVSVVLVPATCGASAMRPPCCEDDRAFRQVVFAILIALHVNVGTNPIEQDFRRRFPETDDGIDAAQRAQNLRALRKRHERPAVPLRRRTDSS